MISNNKRDLLLFLQLLHTNGLTDPKSVVTSEPKLKQIGIEWFNHKSTKLSIEQGELQCSSAPSPTKLCETYKGLLKVNTECKDTTDLANKLYYERIAEVEEAILQNKIEFKNELAKNKV
ncbi:hypothetical protein CAAN1_02S05424 [[Candida] anglica]|uniref:Uncharacterized protein n=1 Tax=[Candida] anglica TaxID=148631 RepID=A0ABP0EDJ8_9ASCO